jgi:ubiquinone/menaquinone biosynthesis C-methylase UbiE
MNKKNRQKLKEYYDSSELYLEEMRSHDEEYFESYISLLRRYLRSPSSILDVGCGSGRSTSKIAEQFPGARCVGIDISNSAIEHARTEFSRTNLSFEVQDVSSLDYPKEDFMVCCALDCFEHVPALRTAISEVIRVLEPGGYLIIKGPNHLSPLYTFLDTISLQSRYPFTTTWWDNFPRLLWEFRHLLRGVTGTVMFPERDPDLTDSVQVGADADAVTEMSNAYMRNYLRQLGLHILNVSWPRELSPPGRLVSNWLPLLGSMGIVARKPV